jgi:protein gp37
MALCPQHTFQVLTKRAERMREYMNAPERKRIIAHDPVLDISDMMAREAGTYKARPSLDHFSACFAGSGPFRNVWLGVSAERQKETDERILHLLATPAAVRFMSAEPLLDDVDLRPFLRPTWDGDIRHRKAIPALSWVIVGGESGSDARPMHLDWARAIVAQCQAAGVPVFVKQIGARPVFHLSSAPYPIRHKKGAAMEEWPPELRVREMPCVSGGGSG